MVIEIICFCWYNCFMKECIYCSGGSFWNRYYIDGSFGDVGD